MFKCEFMLAQIANCNDYQAIGRALQRLRLEVGMRKLRRRRGVHPVRRLCPIIRRLLHGEYDGRRIIQVYDMRKVKVGQSLPPADVQSLLARIQQAMRPRPPVSRSEMIRILEQYVPEHVIEDILVDGRSWHEPE